MSTRKHAKDIRSQQTLNESLFMVHSDLGEGLLVIEDGRIVDCNEAFCNITGYSTTELAALPTILDLAPVEERYLLQDKMARWLRGEAVGGPCEITILHAGGRRVELEIAARLLRRENWPPQLVALVHDITGRKRAEDKSENNMSALLALHEASRVLNSTLKLAEIGERLLEIVSHLSGFDELALYLCSQDGQLCVLRTFGAENLRHTSSARAKRWAALQTKERQLLSYTLHMEEESWLVVGLYLPLQVRDRTIGVLEGYSVGGSVGEETIETLESLASYAASALENARLYREVAEREAQLQNLVGTLLEAQEKERRRVAYEVHDGLTQVAIGTHQSLQAFANDYAPATATEKARLDRVLQLARQTVREARHVIADLRPTTLDDYGLAAALRLKIERLRSDGWDITYEQTLGDERLPANIETALYRVAQEALINVRKHADSRTVHLALTRQDNKVRLEVSDAGCGFDQHKLLERMDPGEHVGLSSMQERTSLLGGQCQICSRPGGGTSVVAEVPLSRNARVRAEDGG